MCWSEWVSDKVTYRALWKKKESESCRMCRQIEILQVVCRPTDIISTGHHFPQWHRWQNFPLNQFNVSFLPFPDQEQFALAVNFKWWLRDGANPDEKVDNLLPMFGNWMALYSRYSFKINKVLFPYHFISWYRIFSKSNFYLQGKQPPHLPREEWSQRPNWDWFDIQRCSKTLDL